MGKALTAVIGTGICAAAILAFGGEAGGKMAPQVAALNKGILKTSCVAWPGDKDTPLVTSANSSIRSTLDRLTQDIALQLATRKPLEDADPAKATYLIKGEPVSKERYQVEMGNTRSYVYFLEKEGQRIYDDQCGGLRMVTPVAKVLGGITEPRPVGEKGALMSFAEVQLDFNEKSDPRLLKVWSSATGRSSDNYTFYLTQTDKGWETTKWVR